MLMLMLGCLAVPEEGAAEGAATDNTQELRGVWVTRWTYASEAEVEALMEELHGAGFNAVFFQVRGEFDAYYRSAHEPWAEDLSGTLGRDPGWDPLEVAVREGHERGLQVHAWINTFTLWKGTAPPESEGIPHALEAHPDWALPGSVLNDHYVFADPPKVREHVQKVAADIDQRYDVDGVHLDYVRYPSAKAGSGPREVHVEMTVAAVRDAIEAPVTAAVWGIHTDRWGWDTSEGRADYAQDSHGMLQDGLLDGTLPMIYWPRTDPPGERLDFHTLVGDHVANRHGRHVYAGISAEKLSYEQVVANIESARSQGADGVVLFEYTYAKPHFAKLREGVFAEDARPPAMGWRQAARSPSAGSRR